jgi:hypothetical protein
MAASGARLFLLITAILEGCSTTAPVPCPTASDAQDPVIQHEHSARVAAKEQAPADERLQEDKGTSAEGVEALALLGRQIMDAERGKCQQQGSDAKPPMRELK